MQTFGDSALVSCVAGVGFVGGGGCALGDGPILRVRKTRCVRHGEEIGGGSPLWGLSEATAIRRSYSTFTSCVALERLSHARSPIRFFAKQDRTEARHDPPESIDRLGRTCPDVAERGCGGMREAIKILMNEAMKLQHGEVQGAVPCERTEQRRGYANGFKPKTVNSRLASAPECRIVVANVAALRGPGAVDVLDAAVDSDPRLPGDRVSFL